MFSHMLPHAKAQAKAADKTDATRRPAPTPRRPSEAPMIGPLGGQAALPGGVVAGPGAKAGGWAAPLLSKDGEEYYAEEDEEGCWDRTCGKCFAWALAPDVLAHVSAQKVRKGIGWLVGLRGVCMGICNAPA